MQFFACVHISNWHDKRHLSSVRRGGLISHGTIYTSGDIHFFEQPYLLLSKMKEKTLKKKITGTCSLKSPASARKMYSRNQLCATSSGPNTIQSQAPLSDFQGCTEQLFPHSINSGRALMWNFTVIIINDPSYFIISFDQLYYSSNVSIIFYEQYL